MRSSPWAAVVLAIAALASVTVLAVTHTASAELLSFVGGSIVPTVTMLLVGDQLSRRVDSVDVKVNGRMGELIAHASALAARPVTSDPYEAHLRQLASQQAAGQGPGQQPDQ